ncbi:SWIM zinc finger family protein [Thermogemmatispora sp.]|uniref:SWIM zinc finger family protein n=1 Tax=Thermogemmatispora sp. TaxID=1968838 RepID=UPI001D8A7D2A|nr:SWIM zinc finger family protein [Thermogemmatispora sp.]MBX5449426.1 SWIM zinc finger family protein [Thermogemmatispora sp.]
MEIALTLNILADLAPDDQVLKAGQKLASQGQWQALGQDEQALWGECQGSNLYRVCVDKLSLKTSCTCPSRKIPCKHSIGLLCLAVSSPERLPVSPAPTWVKAWLTRHAGLLRQPGSQQSAAASAASETLEPAPNDTKAQGRQQRSYRRQQRMLQGLERLDLWLTDVLRNGLADLQGETLNQWEQEAAALDDAQMPGLASRLRLLTTVPYSRPDWPELLLRQLGKLALLGEAFRHMERLDSGLQEDVRQVLGLSLSSEELLSRGERVRDRWLFLGQRLEQRDQLWQQRTWLLGQQTGRQALLLQYSPASKEPMFAERYPLGCTQEAELIFWPSAYPQRARLLAYDSPATPLSSSPGAASLADFLEMVATALARQPWLERFLCVLSEAMPICLDEGQHWCLRDRHGQALPLSRGPHWQLLALSGGYPLTFIGEWDGTELFPLAAISPSEGFHTLFSLKRYRVQLKARS